MASDADQLHVSTKALPDVSLLDRIKQMIGDAQTVTHHLVVSFELGQNLASDEAKEDFAQGFHELFASVNERNPLLHITGLLLVYPRYSLHFLECPTELLTTICAKLSEHEKIGDLKRSKILYSCDVHAPLFQTFNHQVLNLSGTKMTEFKSTDPVEVVVAECLRNVGAIASEAKSSDGAESTPLQDLQATVPDLVPQQGVLEYLTKGKNQLETLASYSNRLNQHLHVVLDGDTQWPIPERLYPYD